LPPGYDLRTGFLDVDPRDGFSVRNFQIQAAKMALVSDIVVYGDENARQNDILALARIISAAQTSYRTKNELMSRHQPIFSTFLVTSTLTFFFFSLVSS
jgi:dual specificity MAP kinase phosphatase